MIKVIIIDDEKHALLTMQHLLQKIENVEIISVIQDSRMAKKIIETAQVDIVFTDIEMPHVNGFELVKSLENINFKIVFTTAYNQYAIQALKMNAFDYIMKPIEATELINCIAKYERQELITSTEQINQLSKFELGQLQDTLALSTSKGLIFISIMDIMYLQANNAYTYVHMMDGQTHLVSKSIAVFEDVLVNFPTFFRAHKSHIINLKFIKQYHKGEVNEIIMQDGAIIILSRNRKQDFLNLFKKI